MCSGRPGSVKTPSYGSAMTVRPGLHIMDGNMVEMQPPQKEENLRAHDGLQPGGGAQVLHTKKVHANGLGAQDQSSLESQRIVDEMLVQERQACGQCEDTLAASSTAPTVPERKGFADGPANGDSNGTSLRGAGSESDEQQAREQLVVLVQELKAMDDLACFIEPVDDSFAPGYSKIILRPMSFSVMLKKANDGEYHLVKDVLEDLELVCYNAMKYNAKRSKIYNAASLLLKKGKKHIRAFTIAYRPNELERKTDKRTTQTQPPSKIKTRREVAKKEREEPALPETQREDLDIEGCVNGVVLNGGEAQAMEFREDRYEGSTCSSSYGDTASDSEEEWGFNPEISSRLRDDARDEDGSEKRALHPEWKKQRRGIEWRARWLEVRMADIQGKADRYNHLARQLKARQQTHALRPAAPIGNLKAEPPAAPIPAQTPDATPQVLPLIPPQPETTDQTSDVAQAPSIATPNSEASLSPQALGPPESAATAPPATSADVPAGAPPGHQLVVSPPAPAGNQEPAVTAETAAPRIQTQPAKPTAPAGAANSSTTANQPLPPGDADGRSSSPAAAPVPTPAGEPASQLAPVQGVESTAARVNLGAVLLARDDEGGVSAEPGDTLVGRVKQSLRHQRKRKKVEDEAVTEQLLATHPLLSRYDKASRKRPRMPGDDNVSMADVDLRSLSPGVEAPPERAPRPYFPPLPTVLEDEPMDLILEKIETLQQRLHVLRSQLNHSAANRIAPLRRLPPAQTPRPLGQNPLPTPRPFASPRLSPTPSSRNTASPSPGARSILSPSPSGSPKADLERSRSANFSLAGAGGARAVGSGGALLPGRRRTADYDISNVVSSVAVGRKTVEQLQHTRIETPRWRLVQQTFDQLVGGDSSEEDTDDESYLRRHAPLEAQEKLRYMPPPSKHQGMGKPTGKGKEKPLSARGKPQQDGHPELVTPRSPSYKRRKVHGGKGENGAAKGKAKGSGMPPPGTKGKVGVVKAEAVSSDVATEGSVKDAGGSSGSQDDVQKKRASLSLTIQIPDIH